MNFSFRAKKKAEKLAWLATQPPPPPKEKPPPKKLTRQQVSDQRQYWRMKKREHRANMTPEQREAKKARDKAWRDAKRDLKQRQRLGVSWTQQIEFACPVFNSTSNRLVIFAIIITLQS